MQFDYVSYTVQNTGGYEQGNVFICIFRLMNALTISLRRNCYLPEIHRIIIIENWPKKCWEVELNWIELNWKVLFTEDNT